MANLLSNIALGLQGFGAGVQGRGAEFLALQDQRAQRVSDEGKAEAAEYLRRTRNLLDIGDLESIRSISQQRAAMLDQEGRDSSDTNGILQLVDASLADDQNAFNTLNAEVNSALQSAADAGFIQLGSAQKPSAFDEKVSALIAAGVPEEDAIKSTANFKSPDQIARDQEDDDRANDLREREIALKEQSEQRQASKMSAASEAALIESQDNVMTLQRDANSMDNLANEYDAVDPESGLQASFSEFLKGALGTEDEVTRMRINYNRIRSSQAVNNLPPGVASDKDIELALKGFPSDTANPAVLSSWLRGAAKLARVDAAYNQFKADHISSTGGPKNLNKTWRQKINSPALGEDVTMGEIYTTAQNRGITPEEVMEQLGINQ